MGMNQPLSGRATFLPRFLQEPHFADAPMSQLEEAFIRRSLAEGTPQGATGPPGCSDQERRPKPKTQPIEAMVYQTADEQSCSRWTLCPKPSVPHRGKHD